MHLHFLSHITHAREYNTINPHLEILSTFTLENIVEVTIFHTENGENRSSPIVPRDARLERDMTRFHHRVRNSTIATTGSFWVNYHVLGTRVDIAGRHNIHLIKFNFDRRAENIPSELHEIRMLHP